MKHYHFETTMDQTGIVLLASIIALIIASVYFVTEYTRFDKAVKRDPLNRSLAPKTKTIRFYECIGYTEPRDYNSMSLVLLQPTSESLVTDVQKEIINKVMINGGVYKIQLTQRRVNLPSCFPMRNLCDFRSGVREDQQDLYNVFKIVRLPGFLGGRDRHGEKVADGLDPLGSSTYDIYHIAGVHEHSIEN